MPRKQLQARFDPDVVDAVEQYGDEHDVSRSEAMRRMLRAGLSQNGYQIPTADGMGTGQLDELAGQLGKVEQRQVELAEMHRNLAEQREQRIKRQWWTTAGIGIAFLALSQVGTAPSALVAGGGAVVLAAVVLATHRATTLSEGDDE